MKFIQSLVVAGLLALLVRSSMATVIPSDSKYIKSLDGSWRFKLEQAGGYNGQGTGAKPIPIVLPSHFEPFQDLSYKEDNTWHDLKVPGNWEMSGYSVATYNNPDNAIGIYRLWVTIPASWQGRIVKLNFDGVQNGAEIYLNGESVEVSEPAWGKKNYHEGGWDAFQVDLTPVVKFGQKNLLAIRVYKNTKSSDMDTGDYFFLGGIHRDVTLFSVPKKHIDDLTVRTKLLDGNKAQVQLLMKIDGAEMGDTVAAQLQDQAPLSSQVAGQENIETEQTVENPRLWSAEKPNLYDLTIDLKDAKGKTVEHITKKIGIREVEIKNGVFMVNNMPVKLTGMCRHDVYPTMGTAVDESVWKKDIELMKAANVNAIRTSHYPYGSKFYDLCDEMGMYVVDEMAACWTPTDTDELTPRFAQHAREVVQRDKNHPCVIIWAVGNENKVGKNNAVSAKIMRELDPTRPRLVSVHDSTPEEDNVEFDDRHYPASAEIDRLAGLTERRNVYPLILMENPNNWEERNGADYGSLDLWAAVIDRDWQHIWNQSHIPGSFLWEWADRAVADPNTVHIYDYDPVTGINLMKVKGLVDGFRNPRADYYHVKMVYAPIKVGATVHTDDSSVTLDVDNRYSFTDLSELKTTWHLLEGEKEIKSGRARVALAPLQKGQVKIDLPAKDLAKADALRVEFDAADGRNVVTYQFQLKSEGQPALALDMQRMNKVHFPHLNLNAVTYGNNAVGWRWATRYPAHLENINLSKSGGGASGTVDEAALYTTPLADVQSVDADIVLPSNMPVASTKRRRNNRPGAKAAQTSGGNVAHVHVDYTNGKFRYKIDWTGSQTDIQELGWAFEMPKDCDHFSWNRKGYWSYYPPTHVGRPIGTATPDSDDVHVTKITRPDAFDFSSTKYDCNWAKLTDGSGNGIGVNFSADDRQHCKGGTDSDGHRLVVNRYCCPPRDISTNVVPDLYLLINKKKSVDGAFSVGWVKE